MVALECVLFRMVRESDNIFLSFSLTLKRHLGDYTDGTFTDMAAREAILRFQEKLNRISVSIKKRNETLKFPYAYLLPERTPNSIAI